MKRPSGWWILILVAVFLLFGFLVLTSIASLVLQGDQIALRRGNVAVIDVMGVIRGSRGVRQQIAKLKDAPQIKAAILRIDSPGGGVGASQEIFEEIETLKKRMPVVASMASVAASGGFWVAMAADKVFANPGTLTGSIGVILQYVQVGDALRKLSVKPVVLKSGAQKDSASPFRDMTPKERDYIESLLQLTHDQFIQVVSKARKIEEAKLRRVADGRILNGAQAKEYGLIDELGGFQSALQAAKELGKIGDDATPVYLGEKHWTERFLDTLVGHLSHGAQALLNGVQPAELGLQAVAW